MISITAMQTGTIDGVIFEELPDSQFRNESARVARSKALDGSVVIDHRGFADGDRTLNISADLDEDTADDLWYLHRNETLLNISCKEGFFVGAISQMEDYGGVISLIFLVKE